MESTPRWMAAAVGAAALALGACSATGPTQARSEPTLRFTHPADTASGSRDGHDAPARVRRDAYGRPIHFREIPLDRHGTAVRDAGTGQGAACDDRGRCAEEDGSAARRGSDDR
ncbi:hypothetical protein ACFONC_00905 [Luteimonas soli]|uniref:Lipoprotein n=1 Tax=Luteimonas soli TaxID=1648966 RepID=A0ABV7XFZ4_9GAMM